MLFFTNVSRIASEVARDVIANLSSRRQELMPTYTRNGAVYAFRRETFLKTRNIYGATVTPYIMPAERSVNIDDMSDWQQAESVISTSFLETK